MRPKPTRLRVCAFTLIEVMVAAAVLILTIVGMIQVIVSGTEMLDVSRKQTLAMQIIHGQIEHVRLQSWADVGGLETPCTVQLAAGDAKGFVFGTNLPTVASAFSCTRTITDVRTDMKQVTYTVTWKGKYGRTYTRTGSTYIGKNGLYVTYQRS